MDRHERLIDGEALRRIVSDLARQIADGRLAGAPLGLVGVRSRGVPLAGRLASELREVLGEDVPVGAVEITLYRDDLDRRSSWPVLLGTDVPFPVEGAEIVLVDDVLHTGRTTRAALDAICDLGRPRRVRLAVLIDRGGRELPIQPDYVGTRLEATPSERIVVRLAERDGSDEVVRTTREGPT